MEFEALYHADRLSIVNPAGDVGLLIMWSPLRTVDRKLEALDPALLQRVAVKANLYGDGMFAMFCNLLFNPQVRHLVAVGEDLRLGVPQEIEAFLRDGLEDAEMLGQPFKRIVGTHRLFPDLPAFDADALRRRLTFRYLGKLSREDLPAELTDLLATLPRADGDEPRVRVEIPAQAQPRYLPSEVSGHSVIRRRPLDCWEELVVRCVRFGHPVELAKGSRIELQHAKVVVTEPAEESREALERYGFSLDRFHAYQERILQPELPADISYTYGNRLRGYFSQGGGSTDALATAADLLRRDPETRKAYIALWDTGYDLPDEHSPPCLVTLFFRRVEGRLGMSATYRSHNLLTAWLENVYGLMAIQRHVAAEAGMEPGTLTVVSHSLGIDPTNSRYELARSMAQARESDDNMDRKKGKRVLREDPHGYFLISLNREADPPTIVANHHYEGVLVKRYEDKRAVEIENQIAADMSVSLISHALWLGRELTRHEQMLRSGA